MHTRQTQPPSTGALDFRALETLQQSHPAWRLLNADHAPLIVSFLHQAYIKPNVRTLPESELVLQLDDYLYHLRREPGAEQAFPRAARDYLDDWAADQRGWLRKYYVTDSDEPHFDIAPATEQAIDWVASLRRRAFIGTQSRLLTVFELLHQLVEGTEADPRVRIAELNRRRTQIDSEIARIKEGAMFFIDATGVRERFLHVATTARTLLSDFRAVDQNFRDLDRAARERIATWDGAKGDLLAEIFGERDTIADSDQGKSFRAFWDFLMSPARQEELTGLLSQVFALDAVQELNPDRRMLRIHYDWLAAGESTLRTVAKLSAELRRYLDDRVWLENRRIMELLREIETKALGLREAMPVSLGISVEALAPDIRLTMDRLLFAPPEKPEIEDAVVLSSAENIPADALFDAVYVDKQRLAEHISRALQHRAQVTLAQIVADQPLDYGLAEIVAYFSIASEDPFAVIDDRKHETILWTDATGRQRQATLPAIIFARAPLVPASAGAPS